MGDLIADVRIDPARPRPWEPVRVEVVGADGAPLADEEVWIDREPGARRWLQLSRGDRELVVVARRGDEHERRTVALEVAGEAVVHDDGAGGVGPAVLTVRSAPDRPYRVAIELGPRSPRLTRPTRRAESLATVLREVRAAKARATKVRTEVGAAASSVLEALLDEGAEPQARRYEWDLGDGTTTVTDAPALVHDYTTRVDLSRASTSFDVRCRITGEGTPPVAVQRTLTLDSWYAACRQLGRITCPVDAPLLAVPFAGTLEGPFVVQNLERADITFREVAVTPLLLDAPAAPPRDGTRRRGRVRPAPAEVRDVPVYEALDEPLHLPAGGRLVAAVHPTRPRLPEDAIGYRVDLAGQADDGTPARASAVFELPLGAAITDPGDAGLGATAWDWAAVVRAAVTTVGRRKQGASRRRPNPRDAVQVHRGLGLVALSIEPPARAALGASVRLDPLDDSLLDLLDDVLAPVASRPRKGSGGFGPEGPPLEGGPCNPENLSDADVATAEAEGLACQLAGQEERRVPGRFANARKGDIVLSPGAGSQMALLYQHMQPPQAHSHAGIMTRNYDEVAHCYGSGEWLEAELLEGLEDDQEIRLGPLRRGWPGAVAQHTENVVDGEDFQDPKGRTIELTGITAYPVGVEFGTQFRVTPPLVVRPDPRLETPEIRARLRAAADAARAQCAAVLPDGTTQQSRLHFSFFSFSNGAFDALAPGTGEWPAGTRPGACSTFIWRVLRDAGVVFERAQNDPTALEDADLEVEDRVVTLVGGAAQVRAGGHDGLYEYSAAERVAAGEALRADLLHQAEESLPIIGPLVAALGEPLVDLLLNLMASNNASTDGDLWRATGAAQTVSPDDMLFWDGVDQGGHYGDVEPLIYRPPRTEWVDVHTWNRVTKMGSVSGRVTLDGAPFAGATVHCVGPGLVTGADGRFAFPAVPHGPYSVTASGTASGRIAKASTSVTVNGKEEVALALVPEIDERFRAVDIRLRFVGRDHETFGPNEVIDVRRSRRVPVGPGERVVLSKKKHDSFVVFRWGGECRAEYKLIVTTRPDRSVRVEVRGRFFEGTYENTEEQEDSFRDRFIVVAPGTVGSQRFDMDNEGDDLAIVRVTVTNGVA